MKNVRQGLARKRTQIRICRFKNTVACKIPVRISALGASPLGASGLVVHTDFKIIANILSVTNRFSKTLLQRMLVAQIAGLKEAGDTRAGIFLGKSKTMLQQGDGDAASNSCAN